MTVNIKNLKPPVWTLSLQDTKALLKVSPENGLDSNEIQQRLKQYGTNSLRKIKTVGSLQILLNQFKSLVVLLLVLAAGVSLAFHEWLDFSAITAVILINAAIGFTTEIKAVRSMESLRKLGTVTSNVRRSGNIIPIPAVELVPGDIVILEGGDVITADMRLVTAFKMEADESALTGESLPVSKKNDLLPMDTPLAERSNMLFKGTALTRGSGEAVVVATGMNTELGKISSLVEEAGEEEKTPLEQRLDRLAHKLIGLSLVIAALVIVSGLITAKSPFLMIETGIALAIASIPEGLPIVATIALARGMWRMASRNAIVNRLSAVETLGSTNVIFTDKTGTLTENRMTLSEILIPRGTINLDWNAPLEQSPFVMENQSLEEDRIPALGEILKTMVLCNNASISGNDAQEESVGDPLELALLSAAARAGVTRKSLFEKMPELKEEAFDSHIKMMATYNKDGDQIRISVKGAPENVIQCCTKILNLPHNSHSSHNSHLYHSPLADFNEKDRHKWLELNNHMARKGLRVIAAAYKQTSSLDEKPYENLVFLGLLGLQDPPREDVRESITLCRNAGIRIIVVTGDQLITARSVALSVNLIDDANTEVVHGKELKPPTELNPGEKEHLRKIKLFARVSPRQKLDLIALHQETGAVVAMTGDGVNDAPALKKANIGVAMGQRGTQVAREAADMILKDDSFKTIALAVRQGRVIYQNIRTFICYLLSCNVSEVMIIFFSTFLFKHLPILPLQILFLNFVTDVFPALALGVGDGNPGIMSKPPRNPRESLLTTAHWKSIFEYGMLITLTVLASFAIAIKWMNFDLEKAVSVSFLTLALAQILHVFNMREKGSGLFRNEITFNRFVWYAVVFCIILLMAAVYIPGISSVLNVASPGFGGWLLVIAMSALPYAFGQFRLSFSRQ
jgi:Ca2+-transporting ATPase